MTRKATFRGRTQLDRPMVRSNIRFAVPWGNRMFESETSDVFNTTTNRRSIAMT
jgi:hypothetical protein